jgi:putative ABC transport system substrate-binding protein
MRRRKFIGLIGGAAAWPLKVVAQQTEHVRRIGFLLGLTENDPEARTRITAFREGLEATGWTEARNIRIDYRFAGADLEDQRKNPANWSFVARSQHRGSGHLPRR